MKQDISLAILNDDITTAISLIKSKIGINKPGLSGQTPIFDAIFTGNYELIPLLIQHGADVNVRSNDNTTPLILASRITDVDPSVIHLLLLNGSDIKARDDYGMTPFLSAASAEEYNVDILQLLLDLGADINDKTSLHGNTALILSILRNNLCNIRFLLEKGIDVNIKNNIGDNARTIAERLDDTSLLDIIPIREEQRHALNITETNFEDSIEQDKIINDLRQEINKVLDICGICQENFCKNDTCVKLPLCIHKFHKECLVAYINSERNNTPPVRCPICKSEVNSLKNLNLNLKLPNFS